MRTREAQENPGSSVQYADIRYATNGIQLRGLPRRSPLLGEFQEDESSVGGTASNNDVTGTNVNTGGTLISRDQFLGNLLNTDRATISVGGEIATAGDLDFYRFQVGFGGLLNNVISGATVVELEPNDSLVTAQDLDLETFQLVNNPNVANSTTRPYVVIPGTGNGTFDYYSFTVPNAGAVGTFDTDATNFDTELFLFDAAGNLLTSNDDAPLDAGSTSSLDSFINFTFPAPGVYVIGVGRFDSFVSGGAIAGSTPLNGDRYQLNVSVDGKLGASGGATTLNAPVNFDIDYADGLNRADTSLAVFQVTGTVGNETYQLVLYGEDSNIADDQRRPLSLTDLEDMSRGSVGTKDPFIGNAALPSGTYSVAVVPANRIPTALNNALTRREPLNSIIRVADEGFETTVSTAVAEMPIVPRLFDRNFAGSGANLWRRTTDTNPGHKASSVFSFTGAGMTQAGGAVGDLVSNAFSLGNYSAEDQARLYFSYSLNAETGDNFSVLVRTPTGDVPITSNTTGLVNGGGWRQARLNLAQFAGQNDLRLVFRYNTNGANGSTTSGVSIDDIIIGFAERGEMVLNAPTGATFAFSTVPANTTLTGQYQLEIRQGESFFTASPSGLTLNSAMDTNDRAAAQVTLVAPEGRELADGDKFTLGDAGNQLTFEFNSTGSVTPGNVAIAFSATDADFVIAQRIRDAINDPGVQARIKVRASSSGGVVSGTAARDNRIHLYGQVSGDFKEFNRPPMSIISATADANTLRDEILGTGINATQPAIFGGNTQSAGIVSFGGQTGVMLSTGRLVDALPTNLSDNTGTALPGATGDAATNAALGVTTTEATTLETEFQFDDGTVGGDLFLDLVFLSEEYNEINGQDVVAVLVDGVNIALVPNTASPIRSSTINSTTNSQLYYNNDPSDGGRYLRETGMDGFTASLQLSALGLAAGPHTLKIVVADVGNQLTDSAVFIRTRAVGTTASTRRFGGMQAIFHGGNSDQNTNRDQGQVLIQNNFIRYSRDYGVVTEPGTRLQDPRDLIGNIAPRMASAMSNIPAIGGNASGAVRNLREINDAQLGGISTGIVISNNVLESGGLGGVHILGENPIYMITPRFMPGPSTDTPPLISTDAATTSNTNPLDHFGSFVDDSDLLVIDAGRTRVQFEFEDIAGAPTGGPTFGSGVVQGNNWAQSSVPIYYREDGGAEYLRAPGTTPGYSALELLQSMRDSIFGSVLVTNGSTDSVRATVAPSLLGRLSDANSANPGYINFYLSPALYLEGISAVNFVNQNGGGNPFLISRVDVADTPQPFVRVVNNTVYGNDGRASFSPDTTVSEPNDTITTAVETWQGTAHNPTAFTMTAAIGDSSQFQAPASQDVDLYKFKLDAGERVKVNIDTVGPINLGLDSVLQIFDASGRPQSFFDSATQTFTTLSDNTSAPGEATRLDPYIDFTATKSGVYYAAVSSRANEKFDPLSLGNRVNGTSTGQYTINLSVLHAQDFTITVQDQSAYNDGETFTIVQIPDFPATTNNTRTFEFTRTGAVAAGNIPILINAEYRAPDIARAIAGAINGINSGGPRLPNVQQLPNGIFGTASPLAPVTARALGGAAGVEAGLTLFPGRPDGVQPTHSAGGIGHNRTLSGVLSNTSRGDGTTERFVVVSNAAYIISNGNILVDPDFNDNNNLDQIIPETGIAVSRGANPTLMNNVFVNVQTPIVRDEARVVAPGALGNMLPSNFNTGVDVHPKQGEVIVGGSIYQYAEPAAARNRLGFGIEASPTNVPNTGLDFNTTVPAGVQIFVDAQASQFLPAPLSPIIDSSLDSLEEREAFKTIKQAMGIALSPVKAPSRDATGQLRVDDPTVAPPSGLGADVFKDRGALDRADFVGPSAQTSKPLDNDSGGVDTDKSVSVIQLSGGVYPEFRIQLVDGFETADPFPGIGIDDSTVVGPDIPGVRLTGAAITLFENGRVLEEGIDYRFSYDSTTNEVILTPLAGVWKDGRVYEVAVNNKNRFVLTAPAGDQVADGDFFTITDRDGGIVYYEFDSGYRLQVPQGLTLLVPLAGGATGGIADGDRFTITAGAQVVTFEFDRNGNFLAGNRPILFTQGASQAEMSAALIAAIQASGLPVTPRLLSAGRVFLGADAGVQLDTTFTTITQPPTTLAFKIPALGPRPGGIVEGQTFTISDGRRTVTFEYDTDSVVAAGNTPLDFRGAATVADLTALTQAGIAASNLNINPQVVGTDLVYLGLSSGGSASVGTSRLTLNGLARTLTDGQTFSVQTALGTRTFEFTRDAVVGAGNVAIQIGVTDTQDEIGVKVANAIASSGLGLSPSHVGDGNIAIGGQATDSINVTGSSLSLFGQPGVQSRTRLQVFGPLLLTVPSRGAADINDNATFRVTNNSRTVVFEFDRNFSGASQPGNVVINYNAQNTAADIATAIAAAIATSGLGILPSSAGNGVLNLGTLQANQVQVLNSNLTTSRGVMNDGETFTINNGTLSVTFEFENVTFGNGFTAGNIPILFSSTSTPDSVVQSMKAVIEGSSLGLTTTVLPNGVLELNDTPRYQTDSRGAPTLIKSGVPGGANAVFFIEDASFTGADMVRAMVDAINASAGTQLTAMNRAGNTLFVENAISISPEIDNYFLRGVADLAGNLLKPNRINNETQFTILMPGVQLDYGDAPDPFTTTAGRYPTKHENDGARHVLPSAGTTAILLGSTITADSNGTPTPDANGDTDDGVTFDSATLPTRGKFNRNIFTSVTVTLSSPGYADAWIDFNADGDWDDPGEKILDAVRFNNGALTRTFQVKVPDTAPIPAGPTTTFARFRSSSTGGLIPTGLAVDGEIEDYAVTIVPGTPPTAVNDTYTFNEDSTFTTSDPNGSATPGFLIDDGVAANDQDPEGGLLGVQVVTFPANSQTFNLNSDGTFTYRPLPNFNGIDTFTYRVNDGVLTSNNIGTVTINVSTVNDAPVGGVDTQTTDEDVALNLTEATLLANDTPGPANESGQTIRITGVSPISDRGGSVSLVSGRVIYTPPSNYSGPDRFTYTITDNGTSGGLAAPLSSVVVVNVSVLDKNDVPVTVPKTGFATDEDIALNFTTTQLMAGDTAGPSPSEDGQGLVFRGVIATSTNGGTVTFNGTQVTYTPPRYFNGIDTFFYEVVDNGTSAGLPDPMIGRGTVTVTVRAVDNTPSVASPLGTVTMLEDEPARVIDLNTVFFDPDVISNGDVLTYTVEPGHNAALVTPTISGGLLSLQLLADRNGSTVITIRATDSTNRSVTTSFNLVVTPVNDAPRLVKALPNPTASEDVNPANIVLSPEFFFDPDTINNDVLTYSITSNSNPLLVTPTINGGTLAFSLGSNRSGSAVIVVQVSDVSGQTVNGTMTLTVAPVNDPPVSVADSYRVPRGTTLTTTDPRGVNADPNDNGVLANDSDPEGNAISAVLVDPPTQGTVTLRSDGTFTYVHNGLSQTTDTFTYRATDGTAQGQLTTVTLIIDRAPPPPHQNPLVVNTEDGNTGHRDVNADGFITPIDALIVINFLNSQGSRSVVGLPAPPPYRDVNGDNFISPVDALLVINHLNSRSRGSGEGELQGEGEAAAYWMAPIVAGRGIENSSIGVRTIELAEGEFYGPVQLAESGDDFFAEVGSDTWSMADTSWADKRKDAESPEIPVDLALASLMPDLGENGAT
ncbi:MAG: DVUA0089 family protein [Pirellulaceae bacterium]|nr:DVUA0089 family protein [Pirellulaceae bacterium]